MLDSTFEDIVPKLVNLQKALQTIGSDACITVSIAVAYIKALEAEIGKTKLHTPVPQFPEFQHVVPAKWTDWTPWDAREWGNDPVFVEFLKEDSIINIKCRDGSQEKGKPSDFDFSHDPDEPRDYDIIFFRELIPAC